MKEINEIYQEIGNIFSSYLPKGWYKVAYRCEIRPGNVRYFYYVLMADDTKFRDESFLYYDLGMDVDEGDAIIKKIMHLSVDLHKFYQQEGLGQWDGMTLILSNDGEFKIDFDGIDYSTHDLQLSRDEWEEKYLIVE